MAIHVLSCKGAAYCLRPNTAATRTPTASRAHRLPRNPVSGVRGARAKRRRLPYWVSFLTGGKWPARTAEASDHLRTFRGGQELQDQMECAALDFPEVHHKSLRGRYLEHWERITERPGHGGEAVMPPSGRQGECFSARHGLSGRVYRPTNPSKCHSHSIAALSPRLEEAPCPRRASTVSRSYMQRQVSSPTTSANSTLLQLTQHQHEKQRRTRSALISPRHPK